MKMCLPEHRGWRSGQSSVSTQTDTGEHSRSAISHTEVTVACMFFSGVAAPRQEGNLADGYGKGPESQIGKQDLQDSLATLYRVMASVESGEMEPAQALASTAVSRAIVAVYEAPRGGQDMAEL